MNSARISKNVEGPSEEAYSLWNRIFVNAHLPFKGEGGLGDNTSRPVIVPGTTICSGGGGPPPPCNLSTAPEIGKCVQCCIVRLLKYISIKVWLYFRIYSPRTSFHFFSGGGHNFVRLPRGGGKIWKIHNFVGKNNKSHYFLNQGGQMPPPLPHPQMTSPILTTL